MLSIRRTFGHYAAAVGTISAALVAILYGKCRQSWRSIRLFAVLLLDYFQLYGLLLRQLATAATGLVGEEGTIFRFTLMHSIAMIFIVATMTYLQAYALRWMLP